MKDFLFNYPQVLAQQVLRYRESGVVIENELQFMDARKTLVSTYEDFKKGENILIIEGEIVAPDDNWGRIIFKERDKIFEEIVERYVKTNHKKIQKSIRNVNKKPYEQILKEVGFKKVKKEYYEKKIKRNEDDLIDWIYENTIFRKERFNGREKEFEKELRSAWRKINPSGVYKEKAIWRVWQATK